MNDLRKDYLLNRWVVIATHRKRRPIDLIKKDVTTQRANISSCPFCPGNEQMTPPASLVYLESRDGKILKEKDSDGLRHKDWLIRCVPNLYSAFSPPKKGESFATDKAVGHHEVLVESPNHDEQLRGLAKKLGCSLYSTYEPSGKHLEEEVVRRIREAARSQREARIYWIAIIAAIASIISALAAWCAVLTTR